MLYTRISLSETTLKIHIHTMSFCTGSERVRRPWCYDKCNGPYTVDRAHQTSEHIICCLGCGKVLRYAAYRHGWLRGLAVPAYVYCSCETFYWLGELNPGSARHIEPKRKPRATSTQMIHCSMPQMAKNRG